MKIPNAEKGGSLPLGRDHLRAVDTGRVLVKCSAEWIRVTEDPVGKNTDEDALVQGQEDGVQGRTGKPSWARLFPLERQQLLTAEPRPASLCRQPWVEPKLSSPECLEGRVGSYLANFPMARP